MTGLVLELQRDALDAAGSVSDLLRKAMVVSKKLGLTDIESWIKHELAGYSNTDKTIPEYRRVHGAPKVKNPVNRLWMPIFSENDKDIKTLSSRQVTTSVSELCELLRSEGKFFYMPYPPQVTNWLNDSFDNYGAYMECALEVPRTVMTGILDKIRNLVLEWALDLESKGVTGEGLSFTVEERAAARSEIYNITNNIGNMNNSLLQQHSPGARQVVQRDADFRAIAELIVALKSQFDLIPLHGDDKEELGQEIATVETQLASPRPKAVIVKESLRTIRSLLEGAAGSAIATGILAQMQSLI